MALCIIFKSLPGFELTYHGMHIAGNPSSQINMCIVRQRNHPCGPSHMRDSFELQNTMKRLQTLYWNELSLQIYFKLPLCT